MMTRQGKATTLISDRRLLNSDLSWRKMHATEGMVMGRTHGVPHAPRVRHYDLKDPLPLASQSMLDASIRLKSIEIDRLERVGEKEEAEHERRRLEAMKRLRIPKRDWR